MQELVGVRAKKNVLKLQFWKTYYSQCWKEEFELDTPANCLCFCLYSVESIVLSVSCLSGTISTCYVCEKGVG